MIDNVDKTQIEKKYKEILHLKKALGIRKEEEMGKAQMLDFAKQHNQKEIFLIVFIIEQILNIPCLIKKHYRKLYEHDNDINFAEIFTKTSELYSNNKVFKKFYSKISNEIGFNQFKETKFYLNMLIFETSYKEITDFSLFSEKNPVINLYFLDKWLKVNTNIPVAKLTSFEKSLIELLTQGYSKDEIIANDLQIQCNAGEIHNIIDNILPFKFNVDNITQVLVKYFYNRLQNFQV